MTQHPADLSVGMAQALLNKNETAAALAMCAQICRLEPNNTDAWFLRGAIAGQQGDLATCEQCNRKVISQNPGISSAHTNLGNALMLQGRLEEAGQSFQRALDINPEDAGAHCSLGTLKKQQSEFDAAYTHYRQALNIQPRNAQIHNNIAAVLQESGRDTEALQHYRSALELHPDYTDAEINIANLLANQGDISSAQQYIAGIHFNAEGKQRVTLLMSKELIRKGHLDEARECISQLLSVTPSCAEVHCELGKIYCIEGRYDEAITHCQRAITLNPDLYTSHYELAVAYHGSGKHGEAAIHYEVALKLNPALLQACGGLARLHLLRGNLEKAAYYYQQILDQNPEAAAALAGMGNVHVAAGKHDEAMDCFNRALTIQPQLINAIAGIAGIEEKSGNHQKSYDILKPLLNNGSPNSQIAAIFSRISGSLGKRAEAIKYLEDIITDDHITAVTKLDIHFSLGRLYDKVGRYDEAFKHFSLGNRQIDYHYDHTTATTLTNNIIRCFSRDFLDNTPHSTLNSKQPVFIVGMPRSGTSLVEQIISSHPNTYGAGELDNILNIVSGLSSRPGVSGTYPECITTVNRDLLDKIGTEYLQHINKLCDGAAQRVTDKMPFNHLHIGLIQLILPQARIIHCVRDAVDTCLSCFFQYFMGQHDYSCDLASLGQLYNNYRLLMKHWESVISLPIMSINYEDLISQQEEKSHELIAFCGLDWDEKCLDFHKSRRVVKTASYDQVRRPIYRSSLQRWKNYKTHLEPLKRTLKSEYWPDGFN